MSGEYLGMNAKPSRKSPTLAEKRKDGAPTSSQNPAAHRAGYPLIVFHGMKKTENHSLATEPPAL
jgi:hypothetical protein